MRRQLFRKEYAFFLNIPLMRSTGNNVDGKSFQSFTVRDRKLRKKGTVVESRPSRWCWWFFRRAERRQKSAGGMRMNSFSKQPRSICDGACTEMLQLHAKPTIRADRTL
ncbi:hypothetical protein EVAR_81745_1 [Eumeta japonica]|uniref:Uncharacterized protein n=1 Tax=Eumeta variegata TaxID=151549 RepID=A0A4C1UJ04_EUMVA|nr:hypothetical protein EVAR_81745_1 [Eumeta japonica]